MFGPGVTLHLEAALESVEIAAETDRETEVAEELADDSDNGKELADDSEQGMNWHVASLGRVR